MRIKKPIPIATPAEGFLQYRWFDLTRKVLFMFPELEEGQKPLHGIIPGYYDNAGLVALLRYHKSNPKAIQFIADMLEE